jgi:hypothetical protein
MDIVGFRMKKIIIISLFSVLLGLSCDNGLIGLGERVDIDTPAITVGKYADGSVINNGDYVHQTIILSGEVSDDIGVSSVKLTISDSDSGDVTTGNAVIDYSAGTWSYTIDTSSYIDGEKDITIQVIDTSSKSSTTQRLLYFDNTDPVVVVTTYTGYTSDASDSRFSIRGEAYDPFNVQEVTITLISGSVTMGEVDGTNPWSIELSDVTTGDYIFEVTAEDHAGNVSSHFYHDYDISTLIDGDDISIENLYRVETGITVSGYSISSTDLETIELTELPISADMNDDVPVITISNPEEDATMGGNAIVIGRIEDDDSVDTTTIEINIDSGGWEWDSTLDNTEITGSGQAVNFKYDITSLDAGAHTIQVRAEDDHGTLKTTDLISFNVDLGAPEVSVTSPDQSDYLNSAEVTLTGTSYDDQSVVSVQIEIDGEDETEWRNASTSNGYVDWTYTTEALDEGTHSVKVYAEDGTGSISSYNLSFYVDISDPTVSFTYPVKSSEVYGDVTIQGVCGDNSNYFSEGYIKIGLDGSWEEISELSYWSKEITDVETTYANSSSAYDLGDGTWQLPVTFKVTDTAGNTYETTESDYYFLINGDLDNPEVEITYPDDSFKTGGPLTVRGTAYDEQQILRVEMNLDLNGDGDYLDQIDLNGDSDTSDDFEDETEWVTVSGLSELNWNQKLNSNGELFGLSTGGLVTIRVRAVDTKDSSTDGVYSNIETINVTFDNSYPYFDNFSHDSYDYVTGSFTLTGEAHDTETVEQILISYNGGTSYSDITASSTKVSDLQYNISETIDTTSYISTSGVLPIKIKVIDNADNSTDTSINLNVDNIFPEGSWTGELDDINGTSFTLQGVASDSGTVGGIDKIEVYFVRGSDVYNPLVSDTASAVESYDFDDGNGAVSYTSSDTYKVTIDDFDESGNDIGGNGDLDGYDESLSLSASTYSWWANIDSENIPDGVIEVHYVIFDEAGNAQHYSESGFIKNNKPEITDVTVGTDLDYSDVVESDEQFTYSESFTSQNRLYLSLTVTDDEAGLSYSIYRGSDNTGTLLSSSSEYTVDISSYSDGSETFFYEVTDADGIVVSQLIETVVDNTDDTFPTIAIDEITQDSVPSGHAEMSSDSLYDDSDADVSGEVLLTGNAWDNQRIKSITLNLDGVETDHVLASWVGNELVSQDINFTIDTYSMSEYSGLLITWTYVWDTTTVTNSAQDDVLISLDIEDYASTSNTAIDTLQVDVVPYITSVQTSQVGEGGIKDKNIRSVEGKYSVKSGSTVSDFITITGYNLRPITDGVRISSSSYKSGLDGTALVGNSLTVDTVASDYTSVTVSNSSDASGYLTVVSGTVAAPVPSINNVNEDTEYNTETESASGHVSLTDDRYIRFFDVTSTDFSSSYYPNMLMEGDNPIFGFIQGGASNDLQVRYSTSDTDSEGLIRILSAEQMAMARDDDGVYHYASVNNFNNGRLVYLYDEYDSYYTNGGAVSPYWSSFNGTYSYYSSNNAIDLDSVNYSPGLQLGRYLNLQMEVKGSSLTSGEYAKVYMAWYDNYSGEIIFRNHRVGQAGGSESMYSTITTNQDDVTGTSGDSSRIVVTDEASSYFTMGVTDDDVVVIVYYNQDTGYLNLIHSLSSVDRAVTTDSISWSTPITLGSPYTGWYVSMAIERDDNSLTADPIHIAAYDTVNADLKYLYLESYSDTTADTARVDSINSVGIYSDIKVNGGIPYIAYYNNSENGTRDSIKLAKLNDSYSGSETDGANLTGEFTGLWDVMTVPVNTAPHGGLSKFSKVNLDFNSSGVPVLGYAADNLEYSVPLDE